MKRLLLSPWAIVSLLMVSAALGQIAPRITRSALARLEGNLDAALAGGEHPCEIFSNTSGLYLDGYGAIFTSTVAIMQTPAPNPFDQFEQNRKRIHQIHESKLAAVPFLKAKMRDMLFTMAASPALEGVRPGEQVVCGVTLFYFKWEEQDGLPRQIIMQGEKQKLLDMQTGRIPRSEFDSLVKVQEL